MDWLPQVGWAGIAVIVALVAASLAPAAINALGSATDRRAVAMATGVRNLTLALFFATATSPTVVLALLAYGLIMCGLSVPAAWALARSPAVTMH